MKKTGFKGVVKNFSVNFNPIDTHKYLMKRAWVKVTLGLIKKETMCY